MKRFLVCLALLSGAPLLQADPSVPEALREADRLYALRTATAGADVALHGYQAVLSSAPDSAEAHWKAARALYWIGDHADRKRDKIRIFEEAIQHAERAVELAPRSPDAHFWLGGVWGSYGEVRGILKSLALLKPIRREMETILEIDERYQGGAGHRVLGIVDYKVPGIAGGNRKRARERLQRALEIDPTNAFNRYYLAEFYEKMGEDAKAKEQLDALERMETTKDVDAPDLRMIQEKGRALRKRLR